MSFWKSLCTIVCVLSVTSFAAAQEDVATVEANTDATAVTLTEAGALEGMVFVFNSEDKTPVEAKVSLTRDGVIIDSVQADAEGNFSFPSVAPGSYSMFASADSMVAAQPIDVMPYDAAIAAAPVQMGISSYDAGGYDSYAGMYDSYSAMPAETFSYGGSACGSSCGGCGSSCGGGFSGGCGGGCGGGLRGGLGRLPGWIGLVGLAGLAGNGDDDGTPAN